MQKDAKTKKNRPQCNVKPRESRRVHLRVHLNRGQFVTKLWGLASVLGAIHELLLAQRHQGAGGNLPGLATASRLLRLRSTPSRAPVVEKDQQEPQLPWFFTSVTAPCWVQSTELGTFTFLLALWRPK